MGGNGELRIRSKNWDCQERGVFRVCVKVWTEWHRSDHSDSYRCYLISHTSSDMCYFGWRKNPLEEWIGFFSPEVQVITHTLKYQPFNSAMSGECWGGEPSKDSNFFRFVGKWLGKAWKIKAKLWVERDQSGLMRWWTSPGVSHCFLHNMYGVLCYSITLYSSSCRQFL